MVPTRVEYQLYFLLTELKDSAESIIVAFAIDCVIKVYFQVTEAHLPGKILDGQL